MEDLQQAGQVEANPDEQPSADTSQEIETTNKSEDIGQTPEASSDTLETKPDDVAGDKPAESKAEDKGESRTQRKRRLAREREESLRQENAALKARLEFAESQKANLKKPSPDDFDNDADFIAANAVYAARAANNEDQIASIGWDQQQKIAEANRLRAENIQDVTERARARYADFEEKLTAAQGVMATASPSLKEALSEIVTTDVGADVAYHLSVNPHEIMAFNGLSNVQAAMKLGQIAAGLNVAQSKKATSAQAPISTVKPTGLSTPNPAKMSNDEYRAARKAGTL